MVSIYLVDEIVGAENVIILLRPLLPLLLGPKGFARPWQSDHHQRLTLGPAGGRSRPALQSVREIKLSDRSEAWKKVTAVKLPQKRFQQSPFSMGNMGPCICPKLMVKSWFLVRMWGKSARPASWDLLQRNATPYNYYRVWYISWFGC